MKGVADASSVAKDHGAVINPISYDQQSGMTLWDQHKQRHQYLQHVEFDVAVTVKGSTSGSAGGKIAVMSFVNVGGQSEKILRNSSVSRVKFTLPILLQPEGDGPLAGVR